MQEGLFKERNETNEEFGQPMKEGEHAVWLRKAVKSYHGMVFSIPLQSNSGWDGVFSQHSGNWSLAFSRSPLIVTCQSSKGVGGNTPTMSVNVIAWLDCVHQLEANGQLVIQDFWETYKRGGAQAVVHRWQERGEQTKPSVFWASGSHLPNEWGGDPSKLIELESLLHKASSKLNTVAMCPCVMTPSAGTNLTESFKLVPLHTGTLFMLGKGEVALLRPA